MRTRFTVQTSWLIRRARISVVVHDTIEDLREETGDAEAAGLCQRWSIEAYDKHGKLQPPPAGRVYARIHLNRQYLGGGVVSHEATHAAINLYDIAKGLKTLEISMGTPEGTSPSEYGSEEQLAYTVGDIVSKIYSQLYKRGIIPKQEDK